MPSRTSSTRADLADVFGAQVRRCDLPQQNFFEFAGTQDGFSGHGVSN